MKNSRVLVLAGIVVAVVVFFALGGQRYLTFEHVKSQQAAPACDLVKRLQFFLITK